MDLARQLPPRASELLQSLGATPRLVAHSALVHDVAHRLVDDLMATWPALEYDQQVVLLGAALHDVGKTIYREEITGPGNRHEAAGERLLLDRGFPGEVARIARTHGQWHLDPASQIEDLLVALADTVWKGTRDARLEAAVGGAIGRTTGVEPWAVHLHLDDILTALAEGAEERLLWQASHSA